MLKQLVIASLAIASVAAGSAQAQEARSVKISIAGIDTHSTSGAVIMLQRIKFAAGSVCGPVPSDPMDRHVQYERCVRDVTQHTVDGLNNPFLTALANGGKSSEPQARLASAR
jgi:UrcA family protein